MALEYFISHQGILQSVAAFRPKDIWGLQICDRQGNPLDDQEAVYQSLGIPLACPWTDVELYIRGTGCGFKIDGPHQSPVAVGEEGFYPLRAAEEVTGLVIHRRDNDPDSLRIARACQQAYEDDEFYYCHPTVNAFLEWPGAISEQKFHLDELDVPNCYGMDDGAPRPKIRTMAVLLETIFEAIRWVICGLLPEGLAILSGPPKIGKSWMVMNLCIASAIGGYVFGQFKVDPGEVLLLSLEDNERRLKGRLQKCLGGNNHDLSMFHATTTWKRLDQGGLEDLAAWLDQHPGCKLVVIDTIQKIKAHPKRKNGNAYENDYDSYGELQRLALSHQCCILVIHHNRKSDSKNDGDPLEQISGSTGVTGSMDTILMLRRPRGATGAVLTATGRDIAEAEYAMNFDGVLGQWVITGRAEEAPLKQDSVSSQILSFLKTRPGEEFTASDVFESLEGAVKADTTRAKLYQMANKGIITKSHGKFSYHVPMETALQALHVTNPPPINTLPVTDLIPINPCSNACNTNNDITLSNTSNVIGLELDTYTEADLFPEEEA